MGELSVSREKVLEVLHKIEDPGSHNDLVTLNMIKNVEIGVNQIKFTIGVNNPAAHAKEALKKACTEALKKEFGENIDIIINTTFRPKPDQSRLVPNQNVPLPEIRNIIAVTSGKGGVGKSTVTVNLAMALKNQGFKVGVLDADIAGPSIPIMFGAEDMQPLVSPKDGKNYINPIMQYGIKMISIGFLTPADSAIVWRGPMASKALRQFFGDVDWGDLDYLLIDMPPGTSDIHLTLVQTVPVSGAIVVTTPQKVAMSDATKGAAMFHQGGINVPILGVIENMSYFTPAELPDNKYYIFGKGGGQALADKFGVDLLGQIPIVQEIREAGDEGRPIMMDDNHLLVNNAFMDTAQKLIEKVAIRNASLPKTETVKITR